MAKEVKNDQPEMLKDPLTGATMYRLKPSGITMPDLGDDNANWLVTLRKMKKDKDESERG